MNRPGGIKVNAGCGQHKPPGWIGIDLNGPADIHASVMALPFRTGIADRIFASHLLEHLDYFRQVPLALAEFRRILRPGGVLCVICPDVERTVLSGEPRALLEAVIAWPDEWNTAKWPVKTPPQGHAWTCSAQFVVAKLTEAGFGSCHDMSGQIGSLAEDWPVINSGDWQCAFLARN